jgi:hypothetical protein
MGKTLSCIEKCLSRDALGFWKAPNRASRRLNNVVWQAILTYSVEGLLGHSFYSVERLRRHSFIVLLM